MWYLINATNPEQKYVLLADVENVVGRRDCKILVVGDAAVSRKHAVIRLEHPETCVSHPHKFSLVTLKDVSKFGTWVNKEQLRGETTLKDGDEIYFGSPKSTFFLVNEPYIVTTSCLENVSKKTVKAIVRTLGGHVVNEWRKDCSLLVMNHISVTIKVICAMVSLKAVVMPKYLEDFVSFLKGEGSEPDTQEYLPPIAESQVNPDNVSFGPDARRTTLFRGMKFIFLSQRQFKKMSLAIELAGGVPILMEEGTDDNSDEVLTEDGTVVMNCGPDEQQLLSENGKRWFHHVQNYLKKKQKQLIQDSEIGYAVLYSSTERHCNPDIDTAQHLMPLPSQSLSERVAVPSQLPDVLVENTEISQQTKRNECGDRKTSVGRQNSRSVFEIKIEPVVQDRVASTGNKRGMSSSVCEESEEHRSSEDQTIKQEKETPQKSSKSTDLRKNLHSSKLPSPEPKAGLRKSLRSSRSPSPEPKAGLRKSLRSSKSPSPKPTSSADLRRCQRSPRSPSPCKAIGDITETSVRNTESVRKSSASVITEKDPSSADASVFKSSKGKVNLYPVDEKGDGMTSTRSTASAKSRKHESLGLFDASDDDDVHVPKSSKSAASAAKSSRRSGSEGLFDSSDDDNAPPVSKSSAASGKSSRKRGLFDDSDDDAIAPKSGAVAKPSRKRGLFDDSDDDAIAPKSGAVAKPSRKRGLFDDSDDDAIAPKSKPSRKRGRADPFDDDDDDDKTFIQGKEDNKKRRTVCVEDSEMSSVTVKREKEEKHTGSSSPHMFVDSERPEQSPRKHKIKEENVGSGVTKQKKAEQGMSSVKPDVAGIAVDDPVYQVADSCPVVNGDVPAGFLTTRKPIKINHAGSNRLPNIIGGSDLVIHSGSQRRDLDDWFKEALDAESQQQERDREAQDLFNWEPSASRRKHSR
ncbi:nibrin-like isoform X2 [Gigantopelta aegis]|uniref:nibrin-like isoform X2 n=1 Tax=Gigantopelta aegis TaxID=1735272 RepID=UPI001B888A52|nr:nibrin-like isoform X2 [Gigantopelta aegis]